MKHTGKQESFGEEAPDVTWKSCRNLARLEDMEYLFLGLEALLSLIL